MSTAQAFSWSATLTCTRGGMPFRVAEELLANAPYLRAYEIALCDEIRAGRIEAGNAIANLRDMAEDWHTDDIQDWAIRTGIMPLPLPLNCPV